MKNLSDLEAFAEDQLNMDHYPNHCCAFRVFRCPDCGVVPLELVFEHHTGSQDDDFKGAIFARCSVCERERRVFQFTGAHREPLRRESPVCECGHGYFLAGEGERFERDEGLPGFFDEGVIVGQCARCGQKRTFVYTD